MGIDDTEIGEFAVRQALTPNPEIVSILTVGQYDYVELLRDVVHGVEEDNISALPMLSTALSREKPGYAHDGGRYCGNTGAHYGAGVRRYGVPELAGSSIRHER